MKKLVLYTEGMDWSCLLSVFVSTAMRQGASFQEVGDFFASLQGAGFEEMARVMRKYCVPPVYIEYDKFTQSPAALVREFKVKAKLQGWAEELADEVIQKAISGDDDHFRSVMQMYGVSFAGDRKAVTPYEDWDSSQPVE